MLYVVKAKHIKKMIYYDFTCTIILYCFTLCISFFIKINEEEVEGGFN